MNNTEAKVRVANHGDEAEIIGLVKRMHAESGWRPLDVECVRETLAKAFNRQGGILTVIGDPGQIRAMLYVVIARAWFTRDNHLEELFCWVHPDHRRSDYAKLLIEQAKKYSDDISERAGEKIPLLMGVLTNKRMAAKVRLYRRFFGIPVGAFFVHNITWNHNAEACEEDFWRMPSLTKLFTRRRERTERRETERV
jgi:GNAT superfamily N-acetyltransferase